MLMEKTKNQLINEELMQPKHHYKNDNEVRIAILENTVGHINQTLERIEKRFDSIDKKFEKIDARFDGMDKKIELIDKKFSEKFDNLNSRLWTNFYWILSAIGIVPFGVKFISHWIGV